MNLLLHYFWQVKQHLLYDKAIVILVVCNQDRFGIKGLCTKSEIHLISDTGV